MKADQGGTRPPLRVGLVQFMPRKADVSRNLGTVRGWIEREGEGHDILVFPESSLSGYFLEGGVSDSAVSAEEVVDTRGWVRPALRDGRPVLRVRRDGGSWVPAERRSKER